MISSIADLLLLGALAVTSGCVLMMYRRLKRFDASQGDAAQAFTNAADGLERARLALLSLHAEGDDMAVTLVRRLNEARSVMNDLDALLLEIGSARADAERPTALERDLVAAPRRWHGTMPEADDDLSSPFAPRRAHGPADAVDRTCAAALAGIGPDSAPYVWPAAAGTGAAHSAS